MSGPRRCGGRRSERAADDGNGYVETDPTGRYGRFDELLGKGAMKSVYRGFDEVRGVEVAWNQANLSDVLRSPDALQRIYSEVHLLSTLRHDAIIAFHASWVDAGHRRTFNFITELFSSGTLRAYRLRYPRVSLRAVRSWARQLLRGLAFLHSRDPPVIHRDLKCDNVFVNGHLGQVKIGDLGLAAVARAGAAHSVIGTPEFMAPELYDECYDQLVDVYSFGMCMLEMLTLQYPYAECDNPAQIYKKVTAGKLPDAFYRVADPHARRFIGRCLLAAAHRPSAQELLRDPFLSDDHHTTAPLVPPPRVPAAESQSGGSSCQELPSDDEEDEAPGPLAEQRRSTPDMTITGKLNTEDDTIFLKVQIGDEAGCVRNIYFPFDVVGDTAAAVAGEMAKELDIGDRDPAEIAAMIEQEVARLVPGWRGGGGGGDDEQQESYTYGDDDDDDHQPPYFYLSSSPTSSHGSLCHVGPSSSRSPHGCFQDYCCYPPSSDEDDAGSSSSTRSNHCCSATSFDGDEAQLHPPLQGGAGSSSSKTATRFCPQSARVQAGAEAHHCMAAQRQRQCSMSPHVGRPRQRDAVERRRTMTRNRSMVEMRSQLLHRTLVEELNKRLFFNTIGAVEDIGFRVPAADHRRRAAKAVDKHRYV